MEFPKELQTFSKEQQWQVWSDNGANNNNILEKQQMLTLSGCLFIYLLKSFKLLNILSTKI